ncbi:WecB/TagA/CpsF family glycosyltransferase [Heyndrickxia ginsengihumi]|uniref:WecB/TagA/CpsF family glycosyltransferase n=1 Tax=Heyndrickxia ginsengihumi TaxID=363870 RepID=UPI003D256543
METKKIHIFGMDFDNLNLEESIQEIDVLIKDNKQTGKKSFVVTPNVDHLVNVDKNKAFKEVYDKASLKLVDGMPIVMIAKLFKRSFQEKVSGADLTPKLFELAHKNNYKVFIFGSQFGVGGRVAKMLKEEYGDEYCIESYSPPFGFENNLLELNKSLEIINKFSPDILFVSLGSPKGEFFICNNLDSINAAVSIQVGAAIDFMAGTVKRAPNWMQNCGLEWFYRFLKEPKRMFKRYFINDIYFIKLILMEIRRNSNVN